MQSPFGSGSDVQFHFKVQTILFIVKISIKTYIKFEFLSFLYDLLMPDFEKWVQSKAQCRQTTKSVDLFPTLFIQLAF